MKTELIQQAQGTPFGQVYLDAQAATKAADEARAERERVQEQMRILMGSADKNKDGVLTREEVGAVAPRAHAHAFVVAAALVAAAAAAPAFSFWHARG